MQFSKFIIILSSCLLVGSVNAASADEARSDSKEDKPQALWDVPDNVKERMRQALRGEGEFNLNQEFVRSLTPEQREWLNRLRQDPELALELSINQGMNDEFGPDVIQRHVKSLDEIIQQTVNQSQSGMRRALVQEGLSSDDARDMAGFAGGESRQNEPVEHAIFISFSMAPAAIRDALIRARQRNAEVYINGLHPDHRTIDETMMLIRRIGHGIEDPPMTRFNPEAFKKFNVTQVPTVLYRENDKALVASGLISLGWIKGEAEKYTESKNLGNYGPTSAVVERSLLDEIQERIANLDMEEKRERTVQTFWQRQDFNTLPRAQDTERWIIDPTVTALDDVRTPQGDLIIRRGETINPLRTQSLGLTMLVFDARDNRQVEWLTKHLSEGSFDGQIMLMTSRVHREQGWDHLEHLTDHFQQQIFVLPKELIDRFKLTGLPARIDTDLSRAVMVVEQFKLEDAS